MGAATVGRVALSRQQSFVDETLQDAGNRAWMKPKQIRHLLRRDARELRDDPEREALWARDPERRRHPLGGALQAILDTPQQAKEIERWIELWAQRRLSGSVHWPRS